MIFTDASLLVIGAVLTALILVGLWSHGARRRRLAHFLGGRRAMARVSRADLSRFGVRRTLLLGLGGLALAGAAADPHWEESAPPPVPVKRVMLAVDVSASMQAADEEPTRLARATDVALRLLDDLEGHQVGLLLYAGQSYPLAPATPDLDAIRFLLRGVAPTLASSYDPGTRPSMAITEALSLLAREAGDAAAAALDVPPPEDVMVFISDGDAQEPDGDLEDALARAEEADLAIHAIGVGGDAGSSMVIARGTYQLGGPVTDARGAPGVSRVDEDALRHLVEAGLYAHASSEAAMSPLRAELGAPTEPAEPDAADAPPAWAAYDLPFVLGAFALACILLESLIGMTLPRLTSLRAREAT